VNVLGLSAYYHDSAAALVRDGKIVAAAQEERFTRKKHDAGFPREAVRYCLAEGKIGRGGGDIGMVVFYDKPTTKFTRLLQTYLEIAPRGLSSYLKAVPVWLREKLWTAYDIERELDGLKIPSRGALRFASHHESHAASAFYPSPFDAATVLTMDGVGEWATASIGVGRGHRLDLLRQLTFPHSLGLLYSAFTYFTGFKVNSGEYKLMGLAPYGEPKYLDLIREHLIDLRPDGSFRMNQEYFDYMGGLTMTNDAFARLFGGPPRKPESRITRREMDLAASVQAITEEIVVKMARAAVQNTGERSLCLAGGVALNCVANGKLLRERVADRIWIQPAAGDAGCALGAALLGWHQISGQARTVHPGDAMNGSYLGPAYSDEEIRAFLDERKLPYTTFADGSARARRVAELLDDKKVIGLMMGRMEFGPRALGHRSIIGDARSLAMQSTMNLKVKFRESFRPFAPAVLYEDTPTYFDMSAESPYMLLVAPVREELRVRNGGDADGREDLIAWVNQERSSLPAITHVDYSARIQSLTADRNPAFYEIVKAFKARSGCGVVINTSFNVRGEPIVNTPEDAYRCFMRSEIDYLVLEHNLLDRRAQPKFEDDPSWRETFVLD
jgi:carbamoyltransferase